MPTLKIYFFGLISHIGVRPNPNIKRHAAVVKDPGHAFGVVISGTTTPLPDDVTFTGITIGTAGVSPQFHRFVPNIDPIFKGSLKHNVDHKIPSTPEAYYIDYPAGGSLTVANLYPCQAKHRVGPAQRRLGCVARVVYLPIPTSATSAIELVSGPVRIPLSPNECLLFGNVAGHLMVPGPCGTNPTMGHFALYGNLIDNGEPATVDELPEPCSHQMPWPDDDCGWIRDYIESLRVHTSVSVECGNTNWP